MKKLNMTKLLVLLLSLCLITSSFVGGTLAKYVTEGTASDTARVAKWGVEINTSGSLYSDAYAKKADTNGDIPAVWVATDTNDALTVAAATSDDNIVAPGTQSAATGMTFGVSGTPEVDTQITATIKARDIYLKQGTYGVMVATDTVTAENFMDLAKGNNLYTYDASTGYTFVDSSAQTAPTFDVSAKYFILRDKVEVATNDYYPVQYTLTADSGNTAVTETAITEAGAEKVAAALATAINGDAAVTATTDTTDGGLKVWEVKSDSNTNNIYQANTNLATAGPKLGNEKLTWKWAFENTDMDAADTMLANMMVELAAKKSSHSETSNIVYLDSAVYKDITYVEADATAKAGDNVIASLKTSFDIKITVTQID